LSPLPEVHAGPMASAQPAPSGRQRPFAAETTLIEIDAKRARNADKCSIPGRLPNRSSRRVPCILVILPRNTWLSPYEDPFVNALPKRLDLGRITGGHPPCTAVLVGFRHQPTAWRLRTRPRPDSGEVSRMPTLRIPPDLDLNYLVDNFADPWSNPGILMLHGNAQSGAAWYGWVPQL